MSTERLKISGWAICTAHSWHVENASEQVFPAVIIQPLAGRIPNKRIIPRFLAVSQMMVPDYGDLYLMTYRSNRYFDEIGIEIDWTSGNRLTHEEFEKVKAGFGEPEVFQINEQLTYENVLLDPKGCLTDCDFQRCSLPGCISKEKNRFLSQYGFFRDRARVKNYMAQSGEMSPEEHREWIKKNMRSGYE